MRFEMTEPESLSSSLIVLDDLADAHNAASAHEAICEHHGPYITESSSLGARSLPTHLDYNTTQQVIAGLEIQGRSHNAKVAAKAKECLRELGLLKLLGRIKY
jgi:hypothetical protein